MAAPSSRGMFSPPLAPGPPVPAAWPTRQTIQLYRTFTTDEVPDLLVAGEMAAELSDDYTKLWIGDGTVNRLMLSSNPSDTVAFPTSGGPFLPLVGGTLSGSLTLSAGDLTVAGDLTSGTGQLHLGAASLALVGGWLISDANFAAPVLSSANEVTVGTFLQLDTAQLEIDLVGRVWTAAGFHAPFFVADDYISIGPHTLLDDTGVLVTAGTFRSDSLEIVNNATVDGRLYINTYPPVAATEAATKQYVDTFLPLAGGILGGRTRYHGPAPIDPDEIVTKGYVDATIGTFGGTIEVDGGVYS